VGSCRTENEFGRGPRNEYIKGGVQNSRADLTRGKPSFRLGTEKQDAHPLRVVIFLSSKKFQDPVLFIDAKQTVYPVAEPLHTHSDSTNPGDDRPSLSWLLTAQEEDERDTLLDKLRFGQTLSEAERDRLQRLLVKRGLRDGLAESKAILHCAEDHIPFTPR